MGRKLQSHSRGLVLCASGLLLAVPAVAAMVISVGDGDTLRVEDGGRKITIRVACIDAPEMGHDMMLEPQWDAVAERIHAWLETR